MGICFGSGIVMARIVRSGFLTIGRYDMVRMSTSASMLVKCQMACRSCYGSAMTWNNKLGDMILAIRRCTYQTQRHVWISGKINSTTASGCILGVAMSSQVKSGLCGIVLLLQGHRHLLRALHQRPLHRHQLLIISTRAMTRAAVLGPLSPTGIR